MSRNYKPLPPLWRLQQLFALSDDHPSGLVWKIKKAGYEPGDPVGRLNKVSGLYVVSVDNEMYLAHRIVYYLRTGVCPDGHSVEHEFGNKDKDNRLGLRATYVPRKQPTQKQSKILA